MKTMNCLSLLSLFAVVSGLLILTFADAAMAQNCAQVFGGTDQEKLIQDIATCALEVRVTPNTEFDAYLIPETCHIHISLPKLQTSGMRQDQYTILANSQPTQLAKKEKAEDPKDMVRQQFVECMKLHGWEIPFDSIEFGE
jgi:hypothetical protein